MAVPPEEQNGEAAAAEATAQPSILGEGAGGQESVAAAAEGMQTDAKAEEGKKSGEPAAAEAVDVSKLQLPEGLTLSDAQRTGFGEILNDPSVVKDGKITQDGANRLLAFGAEVLKTQAGEASALWTKTQDDWVKEVKADPEIGDPAGGLKPEVKASIGKMIDTYGSPELKTALDLTGAGNNPAVVRFFAKMAKQVSEGGAVQGSPAGRQPVNKGPAETLWPGSTT